LLNSFDSSTQSQDAAGSWPSLPKLTSGLGLEVGNFHDRWDAAKQVSELGEQAVAELLSLVQNDSLDWEIRWFATRSLGHFNRPEVIDGLISLLCTTSDDDLRQASVDALTQIGPAAIAALVALLPHPAHSSDAVYALAQIRHPATIAPLLEAIHWTQGQLKATVVEALGQFAEPALCPVMAEALRDRSAPVRLAAIHGWIGLRHHLSPTQWVAVLESCLWDVDLAVAQQATYALGRSSEPAASNVLLRVLTTASSPPSIQIAAVQSLSWQASDAALEGLIHHWPQADQTIRLAVVQSLSRLNEQRQTEALGQQFLLWLEALPAIPANSLLRRNLVIALGQTGELAALPLLTTLLTDADEGVRLHAEAALSWLAAKQPAIAAD